MLKLHNYDEHTLKNKSPNTARPKPKVKHFPNEPQAANVVHNREQPELKDEGAETRRANTLQNARMHGNCPEAFYATMLAARAAPASSRSGSAVSGREGLVHDGSHAQLDKATPAVSASDRTSPTWARGRQRSTRDASGR